MHVWCDLNNKFSLVYPTKMAAAAAATCVCVFFFVHSSALNLVNKHIRCGHDVPRRSVRGLEHFLSFIIC
jgi:hypothetical protein